MCRPNIRGRSIFFCGTEPSRRTSEAFRASEFRHERGALIIPPREPTQNFCIQLEFLSIPKTAEYPLQKAVECRREGFRAGAHTKKGVDPEISNRLNLKCMFYELNLVGKISPSYPDPRSAGRRSRRFTASTHKERPCFAAECGPDRFGHTETPDGLEQTHTRTALFCCRMWSRPLWAHTSTRGSIFRSGFNYRV